eukprot:NODE_15_length_42055_cov_0.634117.p25 type:complete len:106 gc:universal NODE_15_length_42055_cov_0.634117:6144-6461(+)
MQEFGTCLALARLTLWWALLGCRLYVLLLVSATQIQAVTLNITQAQALVLRVLQRMTGWSQLMKLGIILQRSTTVMLKIVVQALQITAAANVLQVQTVTVVVHLL